LGDQPRILAPRQFNKPDPINSLITKLFRSGNPDDRENAKKLMPKMVAYMPLIVRGEEDKGVQVWSLNKLVYKDLLALFTNTELSDDGSLIDFLDPVDGIDLKVTITKSPKKFNGRDVMDVKIGAVRKQSKLSNDDAQAKKWLDNLPNVDDMFPTKTTAEIEAALNAYLSGDSPDADGSSRGTKPQDELDKLADDVKAEVKAPATEAAKAPKAAPAAKKAPAKKAEVDDDAPAEKVSLDDAFASLINDNDE